MIAIRCALRIPFNNHGDGRNTVLLKPFRHAFKRSFACNLNRAQGI
jgi:hypothetical protein